MERAEGKRSEFSRRWKWNKAAPLRGFLNLVLRMLYRVMAKHRVIHLERMPKDGAVIVMINHINWADPFVVMAALGREIVPMAKVEIFEDWRIRWLAQPYGTIPVHRGAVDLQAIKSASEVLKEGGVILISPEGTRSKTGGLIHAQEGFAFLATRTNATVVPCAIVGTTDILLSLKRLRRADVTVTLGQPFKLETGEKKPSREKLQEITDEAMVRLAELLPQEMRGVYSDRAKK
jgi:1-acyl-sn-glycerol-3-phosphate acyltransferase